MVAPRPRAVADNLPPILPFSIKEAGATEELKATIEALEAAEDAVAEADKGSKPKKRKKKK